MKITRMFKHGTSQLLLLQMSWGFIAKRWEQEKFNEILASGARSVGPALKAERIMKRISTTITCHNIFVPVPLLMGAPWYETLLWESSAWGLFTRCDENKAECGMEITTGERAVGRQTFL
ncbi:unnamed protein product [Hapterophycus canaliculatus]